MMVENYTQWKLLVVSFLGAKRSVSWTEVSSRTQAAAPRIVKPDGSAYEIPGSVQVREKGYVITVPDQIPEFVIFDGTACQYRRTGFASVFARPQNEGVLICTPKYGTQIGI